MEASTLSPLQTDLVAMLEATRAAERELFDAIPAEAREAPGVIGDWSAKDLLAHLAAWRAIEARRLTARADTSGVPHAGDPAPNAPIDESNAVLQQR
ncbi:MAG: hypothetical protein ACXWL8_06725, partial [Candidatus Limnocylindria bacterium]